MGVNLASTVASASSTAASASSMELRETLGRCVLASFSAFKYFSMPRKGWGVRLCQGLKAVRGGFLFPIPSSFAMKAALLALGLSLVASVNAVFTPKWVDPTAITPYRNATKVMILLSP